MKSVISKYILNILLYISLAFFVYYLYTMDYIALNELTLNPYYFILSLIFLFAGFIISGVSWWYVLKKHKVNVSIRKSIVSHGIYVFAKYIPGKIWVILGRAGNISKHTGNSVNELSIISLKEQFIYVVIGLILGLVPVVILFGFGIYFLITACIILGISLLFFSRPVHEFGLAIINRFLKKPAELPFVDLKTTGWIAVYILFYWISWSIGFYFLILSSFGTVPIISAFAFPLSVSFGVLAIFLPGGIGVRETIITGFLTAVGIPLEAAITISVLQRLWFICGELFIFIFSTFLKHLRI